MFQIRRRTLYIALSILGLFLTGTVLVLSSISYYLSINTAAYLTESEVPILPNTTRWNASDHGAVERIPRILHQTWKSETLPPKWQGISKACRDMMPDYEYMLWTDAGSRDFIAEHYPWFLDTYDSYEYAIQRADVIRYFVLYHYGGIYLDLDIGCNKPIDPLLVYPVILPKTIPVGVSNDLIFSEKGHPFMEQTIHNLITFDHNWVLNYPTVMFSTGPMFLSFQYGLWTSAHPNMEDDLSGEVRILPKSLYGKNAKPGEAPHSFFSHWYGSSWHADDAAFITFLGKWGKGLMWIGLVILVIGLLRLALSGPKQRKYNLRRTGGYDVVLPHWTHRHDGRRHIDFGWLSIPSSAASTTMPSPELTSPVDEDHVSLLPVPFEDINELSPASSEFSVDVHAQSRAGPASGTQVIYDAMRRARDRAYGLLSSSHPGDSHRHSSSRSRQHRRSRSRGVLFFLPAYLRRSDDVELGSSPHAHSTRPAVSRSTSSGSISSAPPQYDEEDEERAALLEREQQGDSSTASARSHSPHPLRKKPIPAPLSGLDSHHRDQYDGGSA